MVLEKSKIKLNVSIEPIGKARYCLFTGGNTGKIQEGSERTVQVHY